MASEIAIELSSIKDEDLLRRMWQQSEDFCRKKEIRAHMYKLREERLRNFYIDEMDANVNLSKTSLTRSHGDSLTDQSFQSFKTKEIRDSESPTRDYKFGVAMADKSGWNIASTSEQSSDGKTHISKTLATTAGMQDVTGGKAAFCGKDEEMTTHSFEGDNRNFTASSGQMSNTMLKEHVVTGDENGNRSESRSNVTTSSSSKITKSMKQTSSSDDFIPAIKNVDDQYSNTQMETSNAKLKQNERSYDYSIKDQYSTNQCNTTNREEIQRRSNQSEFIPGDGKLISRSVEYPDPKTKVTIETKTMADGSVVTTKKYETKSESSKMFSTNRSNQEYVTSSHVVSDNSRQMEDVSRSNKHISNVRDHSTNVTSDDSRLENLFSEAVIHDDIRRHAELRVAELVDIGTKSGVTEKKSTNKFMETKKLVDSERSHTSDIREESSYIESKNFDSKITDSKYIDTKHSNMEKIDSKFTDSKRIDSKNSQSHKSDTKYIDTKNTDYKYNDSKHSNTKYIESNRADSKQIVTDEPVNKKEFRIDQTQTVTSENVDHKTVKKDLGQQFPKDDQISSHIIRTQITEKIENNEPSTSSQTTKHEIKNQEFTINMTSQTADHSESHVTTKRKDEFVNKRISVDHNPTHEAFAKSLRSVSPERYKPNKQRSTSTSSKGSYHKRVDRSPSRETDISSTSRISSNTVTKTYSSFSSDLNKPATSSSPERKISPIRKQKIPVEQIPQSKTKQPIKTNRTQSISPDRKPKGQYSTEYRDSYQSPDRSPERPLGKSPDKRLTSSDQFPKFSDDNIPRKIDRSPEKPKLEKLPSDRLIKKSTEISQANPSRTLSPEKQTSTRSPEKCAYDRPYKTPDKLNSDRSPDKQSSRPIKERPLEKPDQSNEKITQKLLHNRSPEKSIYDRSPDKQGEKRIYDQPIEQLSTQKSIHDRSPQRPSHGRSPEKPVDDRSSEKPNFESIFKRTEHFDSQTTQSNVVKETDKFIEFERHHRASPEKDQPSLNIPHYALPTESFMRSSPNYEWVPEPTTDLDDNHSRSSISPERPKSSSASPERFVNQIDISRSSKVTKETILKSKKTDQETFEDDDRSEKKIRSSISPDKYTKTADLPKDNNETIRNMKDIDRNDSADDEPGYVKPTESFIRHTEKNIHSSIKGEKKISSVIDLNDARKPRSSISPEKFSEIVTDSYSELRQTTKSDKIKTDIESTRNIEKLNKFSNDEPGYAKPTESFIRYTDSKNEKKPSNDGEDEETKKTFSVHSGSAPTYAKPTESFIRHTIPTATKDRLTENTTSIDKIDVEIISSKDNRKDHKKSLPIKVESTDDTDRPIFCGTDKINQIEKIRRQQTEEMKSLHSSVSKTTYESQNLQKIEYDHQKLIDDQISSDYPDQPGYAKPTESSVRHSIDGKSVKVEYKKQIPHNDQDDYSERSVSPTTTVSDIEFIQIPSSAKVTTDLDAEDQEELVIKSQKMKSTEVDYIDGIAFTKEIKPTAPLDDDIPKMSREPFFLNEEKREPRAPFTRSETYEERCRAMLGMTTERKEQNTVKDKVAKNTVDFIDMEKTKLTDSVNIKEIIGTETEAIKTKEPIIESIIESRQIKKTEKSSITDTTDNVKEIVEEPITRKSIGKISKDITISQAPVIEAKIIKKSAYLVGEEEEELKTSKHSPMNRKYSEEKIVPKNMKSSQVSSKKQETENKAKKNVESTNTKKVDGKQEDTLNQVDNLIETEQLEISYIKKSEDAEIVLQEKVKHSRSSVSPEKYSDDRLKNQDKVTKKIDLGAPIKKSADQTNIGNSTKLISKEKLVSEKRSTLNDKPQSKLEPEQKVRKDIPENRPDVQFTKTTSKIDTDVQLKTNVKAKINEFVKKEQMSSTNLTKTKDTNVKIIQSKQDTWPRSAKKTTESSKTTTNPRTKAVLDAPKSLTSTEVIISINKNLEKSGTPKKAKPVPNESESDSELRPDSVPQSPVKVGKKQTVTERKDSAPVYRSTKLEKDSKMTRSSSDATMKSINARKSSKSDIEKIDQKTNKTSTRSESKRPVKCVATKTINLTTINTINSEDMDNVIIDMQQAKSSREPTPNRMVPIPVPVLPDDVIGDVRYPDTVHEPDEDGPKRKPKIKHIPIFEEDTKEYINCQITEVTDDTLISEEKFISNEEYMTRSEEEITKTTMSKKTMRNLENDECLLSVHDKVSKFLSTAEEDKKPKSSHSFKKSLTPELSKSPDRVVIGSDETTKDECLLSVTDKVIKFSTSVIEDNVKVTKNEPFDMRSSYKNLDENLKTDDCLMSVSDKVSKFTTTAEKLTSGTPQKSPELVAKIERQVSRAKETIDKIESNATTLKLSKDGDSSKPSDTNRNKTNKTVTRKIDVSISDDNPLETSTKKKPLKSVPKESIVDRYNPKKERTSSSSSSTPITLKSTEIVKNVKAIFEKRDLSPDKQRDILQRPSVWDEKRQREISPDVKLTDIGVYKQPEGKTTQKEIDENVTRKQSDLSSVNTRKTNHTQSHVKESSEKHSTVIKTQVKDDSSGKIPKKTNGFNGLHVDQLHQEDESDVPQSEHPSYMSHTVSSLEHTRRESFESIKSISKKIIKDEVLSTDTTADYAPKSPNKFGVELKRTNSQQSQSRRKSSSSDIPHIEEIFDLDLLEKMLETVVGYEQRRRIRSQIRLVKRQIQQQQTQATVAKIAKNAPVVKKENNLSKNVKDLTPKSTVIKTEHATINTKTNSPNVKRQEQKRENNHISKDDHKTDKNVKQLNSKNARSPSPHSIKIHSNDESEYSNEYSRVSTIEENKITKSRSPSPKKIDKNMKQEISKNIRSPSPKSHKGISIKQISTLDKKATKSRSPSPKSKKIGQTEYTSQYTKGIDSKTTEYRRSPSPNQKQRNDLHSKLNDFDIEENKTTSTFTRSETSQSSFRNGSANTQRNKLISTKIGDDNDDKPIWMTKNILKKASESGTRTFRTVTPKKTPVKTHKIKSVDSTDDCVISSYGIGPTDDDGNPLFGIRALKKKPQTSQTTKVTGTIFKETLHSENGETPVGIRTITHFSSNSDDLKDLRNSGNSKNGEIVESDNKNRISSVTKTEKLGSRIEYPEDSLMDISSQRTKVVRRGSVKELTEKIIQKESEAKSSDKFTSSSYPKAGLILRTKEQTSRESTPGPSSFRSGSIDFDECDIELRRPGRISPTIESYSESRIESQSSNAGESHYEKKHYKTSRHEATKSFLNSDTKVTGVQDILDRMRNADNVEEFGDNEDDKEARALLNKFLGASVLLTGMESMIPKEAKSMGSAKQQKITSTRVTKTVNKSNPASSNRLITCDINDIWDERLLKQLLEQSTDYEERRKIRARLRQVMAEKEACADVVASVTAEMQQQKLDEGQESKTDKVSNVKTTTSQTSASTKEIQSNETKKLEIETTETVSADSAGDQIKDETLQGESLLLPLLQGLLHKKSPHRLQLKINQSAPEQTTATSKTTTTTTTAPSMMHIEDSGTESGEDLKLLAAGLHDQLGFSQTKNGGTTVRTDLLTEVTSALTRLQDTLLHGKDIQLDSTRRAALLSLVLKLQAGLVAPDKITEFVPEPSSPEIESSATNNVGRRQPGHGRFAKRRNRQNRHTVGVSQEELADARRYIEELVMIESLSNSATPEAATPPKVCSYNLQKQSSAGAVLPSPASNAPLLFRPNKFIPGSFAKETQGLDQTTEKFDEDDRPPPVVMRERKPKHKFSRQSLSLDQSTDEMRTRRPLSDHILSKYAPRKDDTQNSVLRTVQMYNQTKYDSNRSSDDEGSKENQYSVDRDKKIPLIDAKKWAKPHANSSVFNGMSKTMRSRTPPGKTSQQAIFSDDSSVPQERSGNKFVNKKMRMKRANTIDIPKAFKYPNGDDDDSESELQFSRDDNVGLKGPIPNGSKFIPKSTVPIFTPKTENDHKFLAFIQKQNNNNCPSWVNPNKTTSNNVQTWNNAFGNIKNSFEKSANEQVAQSPKLYHNPARNFWKQAETPPLPTPKLPPKSSGPSPAVTDKIHHKDNIKNEIPYSSIEPQPRFVVPKPIPVNEFSHAPMSAFQPIIRKVESIVATFKPIQPDPKPEPKSTFKPNKVANGFHDPLLQQKHQPQPQPPESNGKIANSPYSNYSDQVKSPTSVGVPWANKLKNDHRVLSIAASKFDSKPPKTEMYVQRVPSNRIYSPGAPSSKYTGSRIQQKRGSLPNDTSYSYFNDGDAPHINQTQKNTFQNEYIYQDYPTKLQTNTYAAPSLPNLASYSQDQPFKLYDQTKMRSGLNQNSYTNSKLNSNTGASPYSIPQQQNRYPQSDHYLQQDRFPHPVEPRRPYDYAEVAYDPPPRLPQSTSNKYYDVPYTSANEFTQYPYTCTDYTHPSCVSTYIPKVTVTSDRSDSITNPIAEPLVLTSNRPVFSPKTPTSPYNKPELLKIFDYASSSDNSPQSTSASPNTPNGALDDDPELSIHEYTAKTQVMKGPVSQTAVTVASKMTSRMAEDGKGSDAAKSLQSVLKNIKSKSPSSHNQIINKYADDVRAIAQKSSSRSDQTGSKQLKLDKARTDDRQDGMRFDNFHQDHERSEKSNNVNSNYVRLTDQMRNDKGKYQNRSNHINNVKDQQRTEQIKADQIRAEQIRAEQIKIEQIRADQIRAEQIRLEQIRAEQIRAEQIRAEQIRADQIRTEQIRAEQIRIDQLRVEQARAEQRRAEQIRMEQIRAEQKRLEQYRADQIRAEHIRAEQMKHDQINSSHSQDHKDYTAPNNQKPPMQYRPPMIVETPSTPLLTDKSEIPSHVLYNHVPSFAYPASSSVAAQNRSPYFEPSTTNGDYRIPAYNQHNNNDVTGSSPRRSPISLSKSDSWNQICQMANRSQSQSNQSDVRIHMQKNKSGHTLVIPKPFEAGLKKTEVSDKQKTVAAYFSGQKSPQSLSRSSSQQNLADGIAMTTTNGTIKESQSQKQNITKRKSQITRIKTSDKASISKQVPSSGIVRSQTMPYLANLNLLDEKNDTKTSTESGTTVTSTKQVTSQTISTKTVSPFAKFRQLDKQSSTQSGPNSPNSPSTPKSPGGASAPLFKFTDPALNARAATVKDVLLQWCQAKTREYENVNITNFSTAWSDGLAFCALIHHFLPDSFDYTVLTPKQRRHNFTLAFRVADEKAGIAPLLDVEDMVIMKKPDWKCVFTYVQSIHRRFRNAD